MRNLPAGTVTSALSSPVEARRAQLSRYWSRRPPFPGHRSRSSARAGEGGDSYSAPCQLSRSGYGNLLEDDWKGRDRFASNKDLRTPVSLPDGVQCYAIAATRQKATARPGLDLLGDGLVPVDSAFGRHRRPELTLNFPESHRWIGYEMNHWDLLSRPAVHNRVTHWFAEPSLDRCFSGKLSTRQLLLFCNLQEVIRFRRDGGIYFDDGICAVIIGSGTQKLCEVKTGCPQETGRILE